MRNLEFPEEVNSYYKTRHWHIDIIQNNISLCFINIIVEIDPFKRVYIRWEVLETKGSRVKFKFFKLLEFWRTLKWSIQSSEHNTIDFNSFFGVKLQPCNPLWILYKLILVSNICIWSIYHFLLCFCFCFFFARSFLLQFFFFLLGCGVVWILIRSDQF